VTHALSATRLLRPALVAGLAAAGLSTAIAISAPAPLAARTPAVPINTVLALQVTSVSPQITQVAVGDRFTIDFTLEDSTVDINGSVGAGTFPGLLTAFSMTADPGNVGAWTPSGAFDLGAASDFVNNAFGDGVTLQVRGGGFPDGAPGWQFHELALGIQFSDIVDTGSGETFAQQLLPSTFGIPPGVFGGGGIRFTDGDDFPAAILQLVVGVPSTGPGGLLLLTLTLLAGAWFMLHRRGQVAPSA
jgi:hypothetical protein